MKKKKTIEQIVRDAEGACTNDNGCLMYPVFNNEGYATCYVDRVKRSLARVVLCFYSGRPLDYTVDGVRMEAGHLSQFVCYGGNCINHRHLVWQTPEENTRQREAEEVIASHDGTTRDEANANFLRKLLAYTNQQDKIRNDKKKPM